jgi:hypothetical protein
MKNNHAHRMQWKSFMKLMMTKNTVNKKTIVKKMWKNFIFFDYVLIGNVFRCPLFNVQHEVQHVCFGQVNSLSILKSF